MATEISGESNAACRRPNAPLAGSPAEVFAVFLKLGLTSFGGPVAHLGYFRDELVARRRWIDEAGYADLVAMCQFLPGPASSQVGYALGACGAPAHWAALRHGAPSPCRPPRFWSCSPWAQPRSTGRLERDCFTD